MTTGRGGLVDGRGNDELDAGGLGNAVDAGAGGFGMRGGGPAGRGTESGTLGFCAGGFGGVVRETGAR